MRRTVIALLLLMSGAAAAVAQTAKQNSPAQAPRTGHCAVGVMSFLGVKFNVRRDDGDVHIDRVPVESWHIDDLAVERIRRMLGNRAAVQRIPYRKELVWLFRDRFNPQRDEGLRMLTAGTRCTRYVFVTPGAHYMIDRDLLGLGIYVHESLFLPTYAYVHALIGLEVYDGETFALLRSGTNGILRAKTPAGLVETSRKVDESFWPDPPNSAAQNAKLREVVRELVTRNLDAMLPGLVPMR